MNNTRINCSNKQLLYAGRICCYDSQSLELHCQIDLTSTLNIKFLFKSDLNDKKPYIKTNTINKVFNIELFNFTSPFGSATTKPIQIAAYKERPIEIAFCVTKLQNANPILDVSIYLESNNNENR